MASHFGPSLQVNGRYAGTEVGKSHSSKLIGHGIGRVSGELEVCGIMTYTLDFCDWTRGGAEHQATDWSRGERRVEVIEKREMIVCRISGERGSGIDMEDDSRPRAK